MSLINEEFIEISEWKICKARYLIFHQILISNVE